MTDRTAAQLRDEPPARRGEPWFAPEPPRWGTPLLVCVARASLRKKLLFDALERIGGRAHLVVSSSDLEVLAVETGRRG